MPWTLCHCHLGREKASIVWLRLRCPVSVTTGFPSSPVYPHPLKNVYPSPGSGSGAWPELRPSARPGPCVPGTSQRHSRSEPSSCGLRGFKHSCSGPTPHLSGQGLLPTAAFLSPSSRLQVTARDLLSMKSTERRLRWTSLLPTAGH